MAIVQNNAPSAGINADDSASAINALQESLNVHILESNQQQSALQDTFSSLKENFIELSAKLDLLQCCNDVTIWEIITAAGTLLAGIGTCGLVWAAYKSLPKVGENYKEAKQIDLTAQHEREEDQRFQYKFHLAKEAIRIFNHLRNDLQQVRSPFGFEGEINRLKALPEDNELIVKMKTRTDAGLAMLRLDERGESLAEMNRLEPEFCAIFGETAAFEEMRNARHKIWVAAMMMLEGETKQSDGTRYTEIIWSVPSRKDDLQTQIDNAVAKIEELCRPILAGQNT
jgi:hypothetical protein